MTKTPEIIDRAIAARTAAGLKITFRHPATSDQPAHDFTAYAKNRKQLEQWKATAARRGVPVTIG